jgi:hypothetical protein
VNLEHWRKGMEEVMSIVSWTGDASEIFKTYNDENVRTKEKWTRRRKKKGGSE